uniref:Uncharacterized protein n=1 Tax=Arundo donax TaxID=35708 RepID=A0A0A9FV94_ARUDO
MTVSFLCFFQGAGTAAHLMLKFWPWLQLVGWEIDPMIIELSRDYFGMSDLEKATESGGSLSVRIGDALSPSATVEEGFAGIVVDLFGDGKIIPQLQEVETWLQIAKKLMPDGRIMVNCGGADTAVSLAEDSSPSSWVQNPTIKALCSAFPGQVVHMMQFLGHTHIHTSIAGFIYFSTAILIGDRIF